MPDFFNPPFIKVTIKTSSAEFDLSQPTPFAITLGLTLEWLCPVTLNKRYSGLFDGKILHQGGLTFTDVATGRQVPRDTIDMCYGDDSGQGISWANRNDYMTLYPGREHIIERYIGPINRPPALATQNRKNKAFGMKGDDDAQPTFGWHALRGFENDQTYRIDVSNEAYIEDWLEGSKWSILRWKMIGWSPGKPRDNLDFVVTSGAVVKIRRPDGDRSLEWM